MNTRAILVLILTVAAMFVLAGPAFANDSELDGKWKGIMSAEDGNETPLIFTFKVDGDKLSGSLLSTAGQAAIKDGKVVGDDITFSIEVNDTRATFKGKLHNHVCDLDVETQGLKTHITLKKVSDG